MVWLGSDFKCCSSKDVDSIVYAEIPDMDKDPTCYDAVSCFMMHCPCGLANPNNKCMKQRLGGDKEWGEAFCKVFASVTSPQLTQLFVSIIIFCEIVDPKFFFLKCWRSMHDDTMHHLRSTYNMLDLR